MFLSDTASRSHFHSDRVASLHRAALPPSTVEPPRRPRIRQSLGRSLVVLGVWLAAKIYGWPALRKLARQGAADVREQLES